VGNVDHEVTLDVFLHGVRLRVNIMTIHRMTISEIQNQTSLLQIVHANQNGNQ
jgi:hypothetical protein